MEQLRETLQIEAIELQKPPGQQNTGWECASRLRQRIGKLTRVQFRRGEVQAGECLLLQEIGECCRIREFEVSEHQLTRARHIRPLPDLVDQIRQAFRLPPARQGEDPA